MQHIDEDAAVSTASSSTVVEGFLVNKTVRRQSMPEYLNLIGGATITDEARDTGAAARAVPSGQPVRVSVTLSEYLSTDFTPSPDDPNSDFGWYTPTASGGSIEDLLPGDDVPESYFFEAPSPAHGPRLFDNLGSAANTSSDSSSSIRDRPSSRDATVREGKGKGTPASSRDALGVLPPKVRLESTTADEPAAQAPATHAPHAKEIVVHHHHLHRKHYSQPVAPTHAGDSLSVNRVVGHGGGGAGSGIHGVSLSRSLLLPRKRANRMAEINQWHPLHSDVSCSGRMAAGGEGSSGSDTIIMHIKRPSFPISTRHFPEKSLALRASHPTRLRDGDGAGAPQGGSATGRASAIVPGGARGVAMAATTAAFPFRAEETNKLALAISVEEQQPLRKVKPGSYAWALTEIRVVQGATPWEPARAEYLIVACLGRERLVAGWRRASDFKRLAQVARKAWMSKVRKIV